MPNDIIIQTVECTQAAIFADNRMKNVAFTEADIAVVLLTKYHPGEA